MRVHGLRGVAKRRFRRPTDSRHSHPIAPNVLNRQFSVESIGIADYVWASDNTYFSTRGSGVYLAVVIDLVLRRVVGWCMRHTLELGLDALGMALVRREPAWAFLHYSDRGS